MDRRLFKVVHLNAKRMGEARAARCSPEEIEAIRQAERVRRVGYRLVRSDTSLTKEDTAHPTRGDGTVGI